MGIEDIKEALFGGIDPNIPGHGGAECATYLTPKTMLMETMLSTSMMIIVGIVGWFTYTMPSTFPKQANSVAKQFLLVLLCLVFGLEIGYKLCSKELLYLLNPCHVITVIQVCIYHPAVIHITCSIILDLLAGCKTKQVVFFCFEVGFSVL